MELNFALGVKEYIVRGVNGEYTLRFNPTDAVFIERLYDAFVALDKKQDAYNEEIKRCGDKKEVFEIARRRNAEMREIIDGIFGEPICEAIFGNMSLYALADGLHVWTNFMFALMDEADSTYSREQKATNPRLKKYTEKYHR